MLARHRRLLCHTAKGLTDTQAAHRSTVSTLTVGGIVKHLTGVEARWVRFIEQGADAFGTFDDEAAAARADSFRMAEGDTLAGLLSHYDAIAARTEVVVGALPNLDVDHPLPPAPWFEAGARWSARQVLLHVLAETAQHAGHADIVREAIDGARTMG